MQDLMPILNLLKKFFKKSYEKWYEHESVGIMYFFTLKYCVQKFSAL
jgi:hypothetical protein